MSHHLPPAAPPEGLVVDLVTPLTEFGDLDPTALGKLVSRMLPAVNAILAGSPEVGEALDLPFGTRVQLLAQLLPAVAGRVPLFFGITGHTLEETQEMAEALREECRGQDYPGPVFMADLPLWYHSNRGLPQSFKRLLNDVPLPLVILNQPGVISRRAPLFKHRNIRTHVFKKLTAIAGIAGLIYQGEMRRFLNYHYAAVNRPGFAFYEADETNFLTRPGAWGVLSAGAQLLPEAWERVARAGLHPEEAVDHQDHRLELWDLSQRLMEIAKLCRGRPPALLKTALKALGVLATNVTAPATPPAPPAARDELLALLLPLSPKSLKPQ